MILVVDANVVISALVSPGGTTCDLLFHNRIKLVSSDFLTKELEKHKQLVLTKSGLSKVEFDLAQSIIFSRIKFFPFEEFNNLIS